mgnify:CR=1 FL=1
MLHRRQRNSLLFFQFTTSQGGRPFEQPSTKTVFYLSIHDLTRRSTSMKKVREELQAFQFTTSQGGRLTQVIKEMPGLTFNSRPHKEVDLRTPPPLALKSSFNSRPHKEVDILRTFIFSAEYVFQFTTSQGGRPAEDYLSPLDAIFQFTTSQGGRRFSGHKWCTYWNSFNSRPHKEVD